MGPVELTFHPRARVPAPPVTTFLGVKAVAERPRIFSRFFHRTKDFVLQPTQEGELRRRALFWLPAPLPVLGVVHLLVGGTLSASGWTILLAASVGVGTLLLALVVQPTPLPEGLSPQVSARRSLHRFRQFTELRIALALVLVVIGAAASVVGGGMYPLFAALLLAWPQLLLAIPTFFTITRARRAMEAWGTTAYLWHALSRPARVTWPIVTTLRKSWRAWRAENAKQARRAQEEEKAWERSVEQERQSADDEGVSAEERTRPLRPLDGADEEATEVLPHLTADSREGTEDSEGSERGEDEGSTREASRAGTAEGELRPTRVLPHLEGSETGGDTGRPEPVTAGGAGTGDGAAPFPGVAWDTVDRARSILRQGGGAIGLAVRRTRRGTPSTRRPHANKH